MLRTNSVGSDQDPTEATGDQTGKKQQQHKPSKYVSDVNGLALHHSEIVVTWGLYLFFPLQDS